MPTGESFVFDTEGFEYEGRMEFVRLFFFLWDFLDGFFSLVAVQGRWRMIREERGQVSVLFCWDLCMRFFCCGLMNDEGRRWPSRG